MLTDNKKGILLKRLQAFFPKDSVLESEEDCAPFGGDWTRLAGAPLLVLLPKTTHQVSEILKICSELELPVVPSGGRTGLAGGAVVTRGEVVLSLSKMNQIFSVDTLGQTVRVQSGAVTQAVHERCESLGLTWPIDLASKGTSQVGGNLSTNAGGVRVIRYGMVRRWVTGLQIVTMAGEIIELNRGLEKNNTGYDLIQLLIGSEGTLAVITEATLKLVRVPKNVRVLFFSLPSLRAIRDLFESSRKAPFEILAFEFFSHRCMEAVEDKLKRHSRLQNSDAFYVLMEIDSGLGQESSIAVDAWLSGVLERQGVTDGLMALSTSEQQEVWALREGITESIALTNRVCKYDVAVPVEQMVDLLTEGQSLFDSLKLHADLYFFGHFGDGSPHFNIVKHSNIDDKIFQADCGRFEKEFFPLLKKFGGTASAEHGVGILKKAWVEYSRTTTELQLFRAIKRAFDPQNLLNPGKLINL